MKKVTFALACASAVAAFAAAENPVISSINFDAYTAPFTGLSLKDDNGNSGAVTASYWLYDGASGAEDGSTVKAYDPKDDNNPNYLELSTEGGTLWRSINGLGSSSEESGGKPTLGAAQEVPAGGLYIDTMVQFTPTEDGGTPELDATSDKLAIWLNVTQDAQDSTKSVTNLCVRANYYDGEMTPTPKTFVLTGATVEAGSWHRLTVKAIADIVGANEYYHIPAFTITIDGDKQLAATEATIDRDLVDGLAGQALLTDAMSADILANKVFPSLQLGSGSTATLQAVGFKGSGALDSLQFTTEEPKKGQEGEFNVDWGSAGVQDVWGSTPPTATELAAIQAWASANGLSADVVAGETGAAAYLLGLTAVPETVPELKITAITQTETGWTITIACKAQPDLSKINGSLVVKTAAELGGDWTSTVVTTPAATVSVPANGAKFMKAAIGKPVPPAGE